MVKPIGNEQTSALSRGDSCELLFDLYQGHTGAVRLGRLLHGVDAGRLVMLRPISADAARRAARLVSQVRNISHPKLLKVMDCVQVAGQHYIASEYIPGASYTEVRHRLRFESATELGALIRVVRDVLAAAHSGRRLLEGVYGQHVERAIYEDTIWIADFGEAFLMELGVFEAVLSDQISGSGVRAPYLNRAADTAVGDVHFAGSLLFDVLSRPARAGAALLGLPTKTNKALAGVVTLAMSDDPEAVLVTPAALAEALAQLPPGLEATSVDVSQLLNRLIGAELGNRRQKLSMFERASAVASEDDQTQFHRASGLNEISASETVPPRPLKSGFAESQLASAPTIPSLRAPLLSASERGVAAPRGELRLPPGAETWRVRPRQKASPPHPSSAERSKLTPPALPHSAERTKLTPPLHPRSVERSRVAATPERKLSEALPRVLAPPPVVERKPSEELPAVLGPPPAAERQKHDLPPMPRVPPMPRAQTLASPMLSPAPVLPAAEPAPERSREDTRATSEPDAPTTVWTLSTSGPNAAPALDEASASDAATQLWAAKAVPQTHALALDEDATSIYLATKEVPAEPSVIIQDQDDTNLYLRAKTGSLPTEGQFAAEPTTISGRRSREMLERHWARRRWMVRIALLIVLVIVSALATVLFTRFGTAGALSLR